jgi:hypothetical protein
MAELEEGLGGFMTSDAGKAYNDHNVYILGAGFAREAGLPLIKDFMNQMRDAAAWLEDQGGREAELRAIGRVLQFRLRAAAAGYRVPLNIDNIEELFSLASASAGEGLTEDMALAIAATLDYCRRSAPPLADEQHFSIGMLNVPRWTRPATWIPPPVNVKQGMESGQFKGEWYGCPPYEFYLGVMCGYFNRGGPERRNTIITLNYDRLIETALRSLDWIPFCYGLGGERVNFQEGNSDILSETLAKEQTLQVLKLHGSLNWAISRDQMLTVYRSYGDVLNRGLAPALAPPTWWKGFLGQLPNVWAKAVEALRTATRIIILGYSIPTADQHFKFLLAAGLQDNISLRKVLFVNPTLAEQEGKGQLEERLFGLFRRELFAQNLVELVATDIREFLAGPRMMGEDSYRVRIGRPLNPPGYTWGTAPWTFFPPFGSGWSTA